MLVLPITGVSPINKRTSLMMWSGIEACSNKRLLMIIIIIMLLGIFSIVVIIDPCFSFIAPSGLKGSKVLR